MWMVWSRDSAAVPPPPADFTSGRMPANTLRISPRVGLCARYSEAVDRMKSISCSMATRLVVPSKATRDELVRVLGADPTRIDVAYHGVDHTLFHAPDTSQVLQVSNRLGLHGQPYVAYLGTLEPRKNVPALIAGR